MSFLCQTYLRQLATDLPGLGRKDFDPEFVLAQSNALPLQGGRGGSIKIQVHGVDMVLHRYLRGGLISRFNKDRYVWTGLQRTRPARELLVVEHALKHGLNVPSMQAFLVQRCGLVYRATSLNSFIENNGSLADMLFNTDLDNSIWSEIGRLVRQMHHAGINHVDLNANNLLFSKDDKIYVIDFDRATIEKNNGTAWKQANLDRLLRSLNKIQAQRTQEQQTFNFEPGHWQALLTGYQDS